MGAPNSEYASTEFRYSGRVTGYDASGDCAEMAARQDTIISTCKAPHPREHEQASEVAAGFAAQGLTPAQSRLLRSLLEKYSDTASQEATETRSSEKKQTPSLFETIGIKKVLPQCFLTASPDCKHQCESCAENVLSGFYNTFTNMLLIKLAANNLLLLANPKKLVSNLLNAKS